MHDLFVGAVQQELALPKRALTYLLQQPEMLEHGPRTQNAHIFIARFYLSALSIPRARARFK